MFYEAFPEFNFLLIVQRQQVKFLLGEVPSSSLCSVHNYTTVFPSSASSGEYQSKRYSCPVTGLNWPRG
jgi:hypothetical protein